MQMEFKGAASVDKFGRYKNFVLSILIDDSLGPYLNFARDCRGASAPSLLHW